MSRWQDFVGTLLGYNCHRHVWLIAYALSFYHGLHYSSIKQQHQHATFHFTPIPLIL